MKVGEQIKFKKRLFEILSKTYKSNNIFIFGSYAYGKPDADSDFDITITVKN
ncbi:MAG: nucleotidyltransferase domain-containing protein [Actinobacteria bacterium]|nr:nucleotidyltransferase domain-containing protein [Actinomycetota bacterium]MBM3714099.1 nucleotidyltransferase domain-containing protein [Actinomycetota bacterium]